MKLGIIADDFTGATDIASFIVAAKLKTVQVIGVPTHDFKVESDTSAIVVSLKSRSCEPDIAILESLRALAWLQTQGCTQFYFKYCSTFDSTQNGNIGPVTDALLEALGESFTIICPSLPVNGRTVYQGHLFVYQDLLSESSMQHHPVTPMRDSNLMRLMDAQSQGKTGLVNYATVEAGYEAIIEQFESLKSTGHRYAVVDTLSSEHLLTIGKASQTLKLVTGGSGLAIGLVHHVADDNMPLVSADNYAPKRDKTVILSGSCSSMTQAQVKQYTSLAPSFQVLIKESISDSDYAEKIANWVIDNSGSPYAPMVYATVSPSELAEIQVTFGAQKASEAVESLFAQLTSLLKQKGIRNFIVAGGETSGVVTQSLGVEALFIGPQIAPGVPWVRATQAPFSLALKSGNFGDINFFQTAQEHFHD